MSIKSSISISLKLNDWWYTVQSKSKIWDEPQIIFERIWVLFIRNILGPCDFTFSGNVHNQSFQLTDSDVFLLSRNRANEELNAQVQADVMEYQVYLES